MILFGVVLMIIGLLLHVPVLWSLGVIVLVIGLVLWLLGAVGHAVGGRRHYY
ncbi:MAG: DUF6131 family protein [Acidimicrobiales bacterium]|jgi:hypothetical protein